MSKKILTLDDLYKFYSERGRSTHFSAKNDGDQIVVSVRAVANFGQEDAMEGLCPVHLQAAHINRNRNTSFISESSMKSALPSFSNRPILGYIWKDEDGNYQFRDHAMHMEDDELIYDEKCIGIIPESCNAHLKYDEEKDKTYVEVDGYLFEEYSQAKEILKRDGECAVSVELTIKELSYDAKNKQMNIESFYFSGVTILGKWEDGSDVEPGMEGANIKIADFKLRNNTTFSQDEVLDMLNKINSKIDQLSINQNLMKGGNTEAMNLFEQLLEEYGVTAEDVTFEYENLSDEELTAKFEEVFAAKKKKQDDDSSAPTDGEQTSTSETTPSEDTGNRSVIVNNPDENSEDQDDENADPEADPDDDSSADEPLTYEMKCEVTFGDKKREFSLSLKDKLNALYELVNDTYGESDNDFYDIDVNEDSKEVYMFGFFTGKNYKQKYSVKKDVYSLQGDRVSVYAKYLTEDEIKQLDQMKANYAETQEKLAKYEAEPQKMEILNNECFAQVADTTEFIALKEQAGHFDLSVEEVQAEADKILLNAAKNGAVTFAQNESERKPLEVHSVPVQTQTTKKSGRYGSLFSK